MSDKNQIVKFFSDVFICELIFQLRSSDMPKP